MQQYKFNLQPATDNQPYFNQFFKWQTFSEIDAWGDMEDMTDLSHEIEEAELFLYPGSAHLFADSSLSDYEPKAAGLLLERTLGFLDRLD